MTRLAISFLIILGFLGWAVNPAWAGDPHHHARAAVAALVKALDDPKGEVRDAAAGELRRIVAKYGNGTSNIASPDAGESRWRRIVDQIKPGMRKDAVRALLPPYPDRDQAGGVGSDDSHSEFYRLDLHWEVTAVYRNPDVLLERPTLIRREMYVYVPAPAQFTGTWVNWYVNGQKAHEIPYRDGSYDGPFTTYHDNGKKAVEQHYRGGVADGSDTGWNPDGSRSYSGLYREGKQEGTWTHWYPDGRKRHESNYQNGVLDGLDESWYENGQKQYENGYKNGMRHGVEAAWDEQGRLHYWRRHEDGKIVE